MSEKHPPGWLETTISQIADCQLGKMLDKAKQQRGDFLPYLRNANIRWGRVDLSDVFTMPFTPQEREKFSIRDGDLLICEGGEPGRSAIWNAGVTDIKFQKALHRVRPHASALPEYLLHCLFRDASSGQLGEYFTGTTIKHFPGEALAKYRVPLAPLAEQHRIVEKIESLFARSGQARDGLAHIPKLIERYRQAVLAAAFRGDLTAEWRAGHPNEKAIQSSEFRKQARRGSRTAVAELRAKSTDLGSLPQSWTAGQIGNIARLQPGYAFKSAHFSEGGVRLLRGTNIIPGGTRWDEVVRLPESMAPDFHEYELNAGEIVIAMDRPIVSNGLKVARMSKSDLPCLLLQRVGRFDLQPCLDPNYLWHFLHSPLFIDHIRDQATGSDLPHISASDIESVSLPIPPLNEQKAIAGVVDALLARVGAISQEIDRASSFLDRLDQSILDKAFKGELVPQDPSDEPASKLLERIKASRSEALTLRRGRRPRG